MSDTLEPARQAVIRDRALAALERLPEAIGRYAIRGELGRGGMGIVYDAYDPRLDRRVAIKLLDVPAIPPDEQREFLARFEREMRATSRVFHENLVSILDAGAHADAGGIRPYYVMERVEGCSLEERLQERGALGREEALRTAAAIARALAAVHAHGLVHRDLKPSNVLLPLRGGPKVADFGLCYGVGSASRDESPQRLLGSAHYMAPEQVRAEALTPRTDLFALGALLIRMFTGAEPFHAASIEAHLARILHDEPDRLEQLDPDVRALVTRLVAKQPERRPAAAAEVARALEAMAAAPSEPAGRAGVAPPGAPGVPVTPRRTRLLEWLAGSLLLAGLALATAVCLVYNELVELERSADTQWRQVENQLARQHDLIPKLVAIVERHLAHADAAHDRTLRAVRELASTAAPKSGEAVGSAARVESALLVYLALAQRDPGVGADREFRALAYEVAGTKNRIAVERARYNEAVGRLHQRLGQLPWRLLAGLVAPRDYFEAGAEALAEPELGGGA